MANPLFIHETSIYKLIEQEGLQLPKYATIRSKSEIQGLPFQEGQKVVVKGLANDLWHKSDEGALHFIEFSETNLTKTFDLVTGNLKSKYEFIELLICENLKFKTVNNLPSEAFVSIKKDFACGMTINFGLGGIFTEAWAKELASGILMWPVSLTTPQQALAEMKSHLIGKVWLGLLRQGKPLTTESKLLNFLTNLWKLAEKIEKENIQLLEINPMVLDEEGNPVALDGVGLYNNDEIAANPDPSLNSASLLNPKSIAIAGVSDKPGSFGTRILDNLINSDMTGDQLKVIKPGVEEFHGVECYQNLATLLDKPVDVLIIALPAKITVATLKELCEQGGGAEIVYLVAGGVGDGADTTGLGDQVTGLLNARRKSGLWTPSLIGPNSLGIVLSPLKVSTLFISRNRLPITYHEKGNIGFISQSGAFLITRLSNNPELEIKYGFCIGNQMDKKASDILKAMAEDSDLKVFGTYIEGFSDGDAIRFSKVAKTIIDQGKKVILYKGGRSSEGMEAAAGHTGAMAGNYDLQKNLFQKAGILVTERFDEFAALMQWFSAYPDYDRPRQVVTMSNAGYEAVGSADYLGTDKSSGRPNLLMPLTEEDKNKLTAVIDKSRLTGLVSAGNPLDITPMAGDKAYLAAIRCLAETAADTVIICLVPLADMLQVFNKEKVSDFVKELKMIMKETQKPLGFVVDSGDIYDMYRKQIAAAGIPVFSSIEDLFQPLTNCYF